jgi:hypothetical protein
MALLRNSIAVEGFFGWELRLQIGDQRTSLTLRARARARERVRQSVGLGNAGPYSGIGGAGSAAGWLERLAGCGMLVAEGLVKKG